MASDANRPDRADNSGVTRRAFMQSAASATAGAGLLLGAPAWTQETQPVPDTQPSAEELRIALIGAGSQGRNLLTRCLKIPGIRFAAICDVWPYAQRYAANILKKYDQPVRTYADHGEMLAAETDLDAVIIATPDWVHAEQTEACLTAGKHVYCEKEMANTLDGARRMVQAARRTGKLLQIGHQRRSNPRYWHALRMIKKDQILGRVTHVYGQWNRAMRYDVGWPPGEELDAASLEKLGYGSMDQFCNWRWYKRYSGGPMADLGSHQVDVFNWFLESRPRAVMAGGGRDYYPDREWYDNVMALYEYEVADNPVRGFYQVLNTTSYGGFYETFMGDQGTMVVSEDPRLGLIFREVNAPRREWEDEAKKVEAMGRDAIELKIGETLTPQGTPTPEGQRLLAEIQKPIHQLHLENFFRAIREGTPLSCPPEVAYETAVSVLKANDAVETKTRLEFKAEEFAV